MQKTELQSDLIETHIKKATSSKHDQLPDSNPKKERVSNDDFVDIPIAYIPSNSERRKEDLLALRTTSHKHTSVEDDEEECCDNGSKTCVICFYDSEDEDDEDAERNISQPTMYKSKRYARLFVDEEAVCTHYFHTVCLYKWVKSSHNFICPYYKQTPLEKGFKLERVPEIFPSKPEYMVQYYPNGQVKLEYFVENGQLNGSYKKFDPTGNPTYQCYYLNDLRHGEEIDFHADTDVRFHSQAFKNGMKHGHYKEYSNTGVLLRRKEYKRDVLDGDCEEWYLATQTKKHHVQYQDGLKHGLEKAWTIDGRLIFYKLHRAGLGSGRCIARFPDNGQVERKCYYNSEGQLEGLYLEYQYLNSKNCLSNKEDEANETLQKTTTTLKIRARYCDGKYVGKYEEFHNNGSPYKIAEYDDDGELDGEYLEFNRFGQCAVHYRYSHGALDGWCERYDENGKLHEQAFYVLNQPHGITKQYYPNGRTKLLRTFHNGVPHGKCVYFSQTGKIMGTYLYENGKCVSGNK